MGAAGSVDLSSLDGANGFRINGASSFYGAGAAVAGAGDVNGDGAADVLIGAPGAGPNVENSGASYVVFGISSAPDTDGDGFRDNVDNCTLLQNPDQRDSNGDGYGNACDPDLNNDGIVNFVDLGLLKTAFFTADADADFDGNGIVNFRDLGVLRQFFFAPPGPTGLVR
jgi:hypothetical protein